MQANIIRIITIENSIFRKINFNSLKNIGAGNCLYLSNIMKRNIENITLIDTFSDYTTPGLIIFDEDIILTNLKLTHNFNEPASVSGKIKKYFNFLIDLNQKQ